MASLRSLKSEIFDREERKMQYQSHIRGLNTCDRPKKFINDYGQKTSSASGAKIEEYENFDEYLEGMFP